MCALLVNSECCVILLSSLPPRDQYQDDISRSVSYKRALSNIQKRLTQMNKGLRLCDKCRFVCLLLLEQKQQFASKKCTQISHLL